MSNSYGYSTGRYPNYSHSGNYRSGNYRYGPWRSRYAYPYAYFSPFYVGSPFYGDYDSSNYPVDNGGGYDSGAYYDDSQQPPPDDSNPNGPPPPQGDYPYGPPPQPYANQGTSNQPATAAEPAAPAQPITLILNSGQTLQVQNYAIVGNLFWDFSSKPVRKIPLTAINVPASAKATETAGAEFPDLNPTK